MTSEFNQSLELDALTQNLAGFRSEVNIRFVEMQANMDLKFTQMQGQLDKLKAQFTILKWMVGLMLAMQTGIILKLIN
jgi:hypothetical protein